MTDLYHTSSNGSQHYMYVHNNTHTYNIYLYVLYSLALEESNIKNGSVEVDKLKHIHLSSKVIIKFCRGSMQFCTENNSPYYFSV